MTLQRSTMSFGARAIRAIVHVHPMAAITKGLEGKEMTEIGLLKAAGAVAFTDGAQEHHQRASHAPRPHLRRATSTLSSYITPRIPISPATAS